MVGACIIHRECHLHTKLWLENLREVLTLENYIIINLKKDKTVWTGFTCFRTGTSGRLLRARS